MNQNKSFVLLLSLLGLKVFLVLLFIGSGLLGLGPDEAQYWTWSRQPDWGYYSKPPGIAWQIWLGTEIFGNTELGVRISAVIINCLTSISIYLLARSCRLKEWTAFWSALCFAFSPLGVFGSLLATTDGGFVLFWTLSSLVVVQGLSHGKTPNYPLLGLMIAMGALFKWPIYLFWVFIFLFWLPYRQMRSAYVLIGLVISLCGLLPSLIWNSEHDWATFQHVFSTIKGGHAGSLSTGNFFDFIGAQAALVSPILFVLLIMAIAAMFCRLLYMWPSILFCGTAAAILLTVYSLLAVQQKMQGNWVVFAYPTGFILLAWYACESVSWGRKWLKGGVALSLCLCLIALSLPFTSFLPYKMNPFKHNLGWNKMAAALKDSGYDPDDDFLFSDKYQTSSLISFYSPQKKRAYFLNLQGARKNQFSYWPSMKKEQLNRNGFFVLVENIPYLKNVSVGDYIEKLSPYFEKVDFLGKKALIEQNNESVKSIFLFKCYRYNGKTPENVKLY